MTAISTKKKKRKEKWEKGKKRKRGEERKRRVVSGIMPQVEEENMRGDEERKMHERLRPWCKGEKWRRAAKDAIVKG